MKLYLFITIVSIIFVAVRVSLNKNFDPSGLLVIFLQEVGSIFRKESAEKIKWRQATNSKSSDKS